jgi:prepilin-type processing-associated H-X9-DG protein
MHCPSDPYTGLTILWSNTPNTESRIIHYYAVGGSIEFTTTPHSDGTLFPTGNNRHCNANDGMFYNDSGTKLSDIRDGTAQTAMLCEVWGRRTPNHTLPEDSRGMSLHNLVYLDWTPNTNRNNAYKANGFHKGGVNVLFADGSVHFIANTINLPTFKAMATIRSGDVVDQEKAGF